MANLNNHSILNFVNSVIVDCIIITVNASSSNQINMVNILIIISTFFLNDYIYLKCLVVSPVFFINSQEKKRE